MIGNVTVFFRAPASDTYWPTIVLVLRDGPVEWMLDADYEPCMPPLQILCEHLAAAVPEWQGRIAHERGRRYLKTFRLKVKKPPTPPTHPNGGGALLPLPEGICA